MCLGGGYAAAWLAKSLRGAIREGGVELTVVSRDNYHTFHGFIGEMLTGKIQPGQITSPARRIFPPARFHCAEIESVDVARRLVTTSRPLDGRQTVLEYDHLVVAIGSTDDLSRYPGLAEHAFRLKTYWDCFRARNHLLSMMELAEQEPDRLERRRLLTFVVAGGNYGGVEVAAELNDWTRRLVRKEYPHIDPADVRVMLVHAGDRILPELAQVQPKLQRWAERYLATTELEIRLETRVTAATPEEVVLSTGERIATRTLINCAGTAAWPLLDALPFPRDDRGRLVCDAFARVAGTDRVWAAGDCAAVPHPAGGTVPPLGIWAMTVGRRVGKNILRQLAGRPLQAYAFTGLGDACSLGRRRAVSHLRGVRMYGLPAWIAWRGFLLYFVPSWDRKLRLLADWLLAPLVGRDVVNPRAEEPPAMQRELYEPGQAIVRQGEIGRRLYLVTSGEVEVVHRDDGGAERVVAVLGAGSHFGERAVFRHVRRTATVRARTRVELVSLGGHAAVSLAAGGALVRELRETPRAGTAPLAAAIPSEPASRTPSLLQ